MKAISIIASPRKNGNCSKIVETMTKTIKENGGQNTVYYVDDLNIKGCQGCGGCRNPEKPSKCVIKDDFRMIMDQFDNDADAIIFAAPNYFGEINAQGHIFMDRFYSMTKSTLNMLTGNKKAAVIFTYGATSGYYDEYINKRAKLFESIGFKLEAVLSAGEGKPNSGNADDVLKQAQEIALKLMQ